jgi:hypothetical protein
MRSSILVEFNPNHLMHVGWVNADSVAFTRTQSGLDSDADWRAGVNRATDTIRLQAIDTMPGIGRRHLIHIPARTTQTGFNHRKLNNISCFIVFSANTCTTTV